ncbi:transcription factor Adf-1-like [Diorhabda carinulata]|uniref:transcription factor Adf-1-like n=1 Tax=Diorhabda sublineata TaxID=1163346 RepID=UPI0024E090B1|nr:transcription factor Adf-1-like [Diorhabda sublineata]XP_056643666.1 transcription factor Adf-1-like [Diorhabda sublineata]XP_056643667.1 transcription factor Adf-1-like [Diorhabda sublineata]XP_057660318.1 transcription factor Adf-1-like [Diorhabda carinulata]XP_057660319.1 transcription factor Adf-1-like [Diorhabda carinulata]
MTESDLTSVWDVDIGLLIKMVKNFPYLYNQNYEEFKNVELRERTWAKISTNLKISISDCQRLWKNLRDKYSRERRSLNGQGSSAWEFYESMKFLDGFVRRRRRAKKSQNRNLINNSSTKNEIKKEDNNSATEIQVWDEETVDSSISPENLQFLEDENYDNGEAEITLDLIDNLPVKEVNEQENSVNIVRYRTSEEAFGAYVASRLLDFPLDDRQAKKVKIFKVLEDLDHIL